MDSSRPTRDATSRLSRAQIRARLAERLVGGSEPMRRLRERVAGLAPLRVPVLISGEPGTGRGAVAAALHEVGPTAAGELARLAASALAGRAGLPDPGSLHLVDVEDLAPELQAALREHLEHGSPRGFAPGLRIFASTRDPLRLSAPGARFDAALARVLLRFHVRLPALRERPGDVPELAAHLCARIGRSLRRERIRIAPDALELLARQRWPGNLRELEEVLGRAIAFSSRATLGRELVEEILGEVGESLGAIRHRHATRERERLLAELRASGGNVTRTAEVLGKSRAAVYRLIEKHGIALSKSPAS